MASPRDQDVFLPDVDDDDGMPPLVDNPLPPMTFTFATDMTPITYSAAPNGFEAMPQTVPQNTFIYSPSDFPAFEPTKSSHAKKRDASYIPRPPNAFILFRSSFIRAQHIPGKIEGNHSALSKIIGKYWKSLPREEREVWEAKAITAQAEHRKRYPDWRFRPSANALAKVKDGPRKRTNKKGRGEAEKEERNRDQRCSKIADLLVAGKKGNDLQVAIEAYDCETGVTKDVKEEGGGVVVMKVQEQDIPSVSAGVPPNVPLAKGNARPADHAIREDTRPLTPGAYPDGRFKLPLTSMFKRSSSAPAAHSRGNSFVVDTFAEGNVTSLTTSGVKHASGPVESLGTEISTEPRVVGDITSFSTPSTRMEDVNRLTVLPSSVPAISTGITDFSQVHDNISPIQGYDTYDHSVLDINATFSPYSPAPTTPGFEPDVDEISTPAQSPPSQAFDYLFHGAGDRVNSPYVSHMPAYGTGEKTASDGTDHHHGFGITHVQPPFSSLKEWAGVSPVKRPSLGCTNSWMGTFPHTQEPVIYDADRVMKDAFAAATVSYEEWISGIGPAAQLSLHCNDLQNIQYYAQGWQNVTMTAGNYDNGQQLF